MRLKSIKLSGFKSFVDSTNVNFPSNLCAVVGPNGCGKSNVIDAVRWVMGESSAKNLRGESMADVIFNGSGGRKPVGQASVELIFDNTAQRIVGEYAQRGKLGHSAWQHDRTRVASQLIPYQRARRERPLAGIQGGRGTHRRSRRTQSARERRAST